MARARKWGTDASSEKALAQLRTQQRQRRNHGGITEKGRSICRPRPEVASGPRPCGGREG
jgi:hypothetical protein